MNETQTKPQAEPVVDPSRLVLDCGYIEPGADETCGADGVIFYVHPSRLARITEDDADYVCAKHLPAVMGAQAGGFERWHVRIVQDI